jgi:hypothetical protein
VCDTQYTCAVTHTALSQRLWPHANDQICNGVLFLGPCMDLVGRSVLFSAVERGGCRGAGGMPSDTVFSPVPKAARSIPLAQ